MVSILQSVGDQLAAIGHLSLSLSLSVVFIASYCIYQLYFHPLAKYPGPKLAALTGLWELSFMTDFVPRLAALHEKYDSPVIRVGPNYLHFGDMKHYHAIYRNQNTFLKDPAFYYRLGISGSVISEVDPKIHKKLSDIIAPYMSQKAVENRLDELIAKVQVVCHVVQQSVDEGKTLDAKELFARATWDTIFNLTFGDDPQIIDNYFEQRAYVLDDMGMFLQTTLFFKYVPGLSKVAMMLPTWLIGPVMTGFAAFRRRATALVLESARRFEKYGAVRADSRSIFDGLLEPHMSSNYSGDKKSLPVKHLTDEAFLLLVAGTESTAQALTTLIYELSRNPKYVKMLREQLVEFRDQGTGEVDLRRAIRLPLLNSLINEAFRIASPVTTSLPRLSPPGGADIGEYSIPGNTRVGCSIEVAHMDSSVFPDPSAFIPERWDGEKGRALSKHMVAFGEGSRRCAGMHLANAEIRLTLIMLFSKYDFEFVDPDFDLEWYDRGSRAFKKEPRVRAVLRGDS